MAQSGGFLTWPDPNGVGFLRPGCVWFFFSEKLA